MGYARILKDQAGVPSGYRECDGAVAWLPAQESYQNVFRRVKLDLKTIEVVNHDFIKDANRVYRQGVLLRGITPEGFRTYNAIYTGNHQVIYTPYGDAKIAHPASFEALDSGVPQGKRQFPYSYGRDEEFVYFFTCSTDTRHAVKLKACRNPRIFSVLSGKYGVDDLHVYYGEVVVKKADPNTFAVLTDGYARDHRHVYIGNRLLEADANTFTVLREGYAADCKQWFFRGTPTDKAPEWYIAEAGDP